MDRIINFSKLEYRYQIFLLLLLLSSMSVPLTIFRNAAPQSVKAPVQAQEMKQNTQATSLYSPIATTLIAVMFDGIPPGTDVTITVGTDYETTVQTDLSGEETLVPFPNWIYPGTYDVEVFPVEAQLFSFPLTVTEGMGQEEIKYQFVSQINSHDFIPAER